MENVNVLHPGNKVNDPHVKKVRSSNRFDEKYALAQGQRFGQLNAPFFFDAVAKDKVTLRSAHNIRSYTLKSPLLSDLSLKKDFFQVTRRAILPLNWEKFFDNPPLGDDVSQDVGTTVADFDSKVALIVNNGIAAEHSSGQIDDDSTLQIFFETAVFISYFYSYGSLLAAAGYSMETQFSSGKVACPSADEWIDAVLADIKYKLGTDYYFTYVNTETSETYRVYGDNDSAVADYRDHAIGLRRFFELILENPSFALAWSNIAPALVDEDGHALSLYDVSTISATPVENCPVDLARLFAYQMCCAHFYTNDSVDYVYSADLYRQTVRAAASNVATQWSSDGVQDPFTSFMYNGIACQYDDCSAHIVEKIFTAVLIVLSGVGQSISIIPALQYFSLIFAWRSSLRFTDYFTGSKTRPLAVGDINVAVNSGSPNYVSVLDITKNIQRQRFFNAVNRTGRKIEQYLEGIFGTKPSHDWHNPLWLGHTKDTIIADEVENNTFNPSDSEGNNEQLVSATLRGAANNFAFEVDIDEPSILVGISYFDIPRFYTHSSERIMMHQDRFDMFNPFMQFIGDQKVFTRELYDNTNFVSAGAGNDAGDIFGYTMRHMEYKQRFSRALGPFATGVLPSWIFTDNIFGRGDDDRLTPDFIRSSCIELDKYYTSLSYYSLANYFHFIVLTYNECSAVRNMVYAPNIL